MKPPPAGLAELLVDASADGLLAFGRDFRILSWNAAMERTTGLDAASVVGRMAFDLFPFLVETGEDLLWRRTLERVESTSRDRPFEILGTGRRGWYTAQYRPWVEHGEVVGGLAVLRDTTEEIEGRRRLSETESRFEAMANASPVLLWMARTDGMCTFFNATWLDFTGQTLEHEWGVGWASGVHFEDFQRCMDTYSTAFRERRPLEMTYRLRRADGAFRWILDRGVPRYAEDGSFAGYIGSCVDISERMTQELELRRAVRDRDDFLSVAAHELRTPLASLRLQVEVLRRSLDPEQSPLVVKRAEQVHQSARRLGELVTVLLDVSRLSAEHLELSRQEVDLVDLIHRAVERFRPSADAQQVPVHFEARSGDGIACVDPTRVEQVVGNLLSNALKFGAGHPVRVTVEADAEDVWLVVADEGIGIPRDAIGRIFERYERAGVSPQRYSGLGLGLWIVHHLVRAHGGTITVESEIGKGSRFEVRLPRRAVAVARAEDHLEVG